MKKLMSLVAAGVLVVAMGGTATAGPPHGSSRGGGGHGNGMGGNVQHRSGQNTRNGSFSNHGSRPGRKYAGKGHHHWTKKVWSSRYRCWVFYDPNTEEDYYWCEPDNCYYPVSYCPYGRYDF